MPVSPSERLLVSVVCVWAVWPVTDSSRPDRVFDPVEEALGPRESLEELEELAEEIARVDDERLRRLSVSL